MRTPSLDRRVVAVGMGVVAVLALGLDVLLYASVRSIANDRTNAAFDSQAALVNAVVDAESGVPNLRELTTRLEGLGVEASLQVHGGPVFRSRPSGSDTSTPKVSREVPVADGMKVVLFQRAPDADPSVRHILLVEAVATPLVIALAALLLRWISEVAMAPLGEIAAAARRTTSGRPGERLSPDRPETRLGQVAAAYDSMLDALEGAVTQAQAAEASTRRFLDDAAHQLRTPITSIRASAETLSRNVTADQRDRLLAAVIRESERAGRLMTGLLRMARLDHPQALVPEPTDLLTLCEDEADQARLDSPHLDISVGVPDAQPLGRPEIAADAVSEIVANLIDNARRHARSSVRITLQRDDQWVRIMVGDDGPGLAPDQTDIAFDRFVSLDARGGSGLGLSIARELARAHGGNLTYEDRVFVVRLPTQHRNGHPVKVNEGIMGGT